MKKTVFSEEIEARLKAYQRRATTVRRTDSWGRYAAVGAIAASATTAEGVIVHVSPASPPTVFSPGTNSSTSVSVDLVNLPGLAPGDDLSVRIRDFSGQFFTSTYGGVFSFRSGNIELDGLDYGSDFRLAINQFGGSAARLSSGDVISSGVLGFNPGTVRLLGAYAPSYSPSYPLLFGEFSGGTGLAGFQFGAGPSTRNGWIRVDVELTPNGFPAAVTLLEWAYQVIPNAPIVAGDTGAPQANPPGDYNDDGVVDIEDYTSWRDNVGSPAGSLPNDTDGGVIDDDQYNTWVSNFGSTESESTAIPEPTGLLLLATGAAGIGAIRRRVG